MKQYNKFDNQYEIHCERSSGVGRNLLVTGGFCSGADLKYKFSLSIFYENSSFILAF